MCKEAARIDQIGTSLYSDLARECNGKAAEKAETDELKMSCLPLQSKRLLLLTSLIFSNVIAVGFSAATLLTVLKLNGICSYVFPHYGPSVSTDTIFSLAVGHNRL